MPAPLVTALITNYNYGRFLAEAVDGALAQSHPAVEVLVVDDGSTDESREVLRRYGDRIRVILKENGGQGSAFNAGIEAARGEIICFLDSDDGFAPGKVAAVVEKFAAGPWGMVCHDLDVRGGSGLPGETWCRNHAVLLRDGDLFEELRDRALPWIFPPTSGLSLRATLARRIAPFPEADWRICADGPLALAAACLEPVGAIAAPLGFYRVHGENAFGVAGPAIPLSRRVSHFDVAARSARFLRDFLAREGKPLDVDILANYDYLRTWSFTTRALPLADVPRLWRARLRAARWTRERWPSIVKAFVKDALVATAISLRVPTRYGPFRSNKQ